jgi:hypothetical protein
MKRTAITVALLCLTVGVVAQQATRDRVYVVKDHGAIKLSMPDGWREQTRSSDAGPPTIELSSPDGQMLLLITPLWSPRADEKFNSTEKIAEAIEKAAKSVVSTAVEKELILRPIKTSSGEGRYFSATDRAPKTGEYRFMANGAVPAGKLLLSFTVLSHVAPPEGIARALEVVASASHSL